MLRFLSFRAPAGRVACLAALFLLHSAAVSAQDKIQRWYENLDRGVEAARKSGKPLFIVFRCVR
jgi:hypothetical protein